MSTNAVGDGSNIAGLGNDDKKAPFLFNKWKNKIAKRLRKELNVGKR